MRVGAEVVLAVRGLTVGPPGGQPVARDVSLDLRQGEWVGITGTNGAGKTTLALALAGLWPSRSGTVDLEGQQLEPGSPARARVGMVLQEPGLQLTQATVREEIAFAAANLGRPEATARADADRIAASLGLERELDRVPRDLSAGRQQLVLIAAALTARPAVLVADEACAHLDAKGRCAALDGVRSAVREGLAVVWVTQHPGELGQADRVMVLAGGRLEPWPAANAASRDPAASRGPNPAGEGPGAAGSPRAIVSIVPGGVGNRVHAPSGTTFELPSSGVLALTGPNGAGKTTVLECIAGVASRAEVRIQWREPPRPPPLMIGELPDHQIFEERAGAELVHAAVHRGVPRERAEAEAVAALRDFGLEREFLDRRTWSLSSGEKRLALTIGGLIAPAVVLVLDEPTCGLDASRRGGLAARIRRRAALGPVVVAGQDREWIASLDADVVELGRESL